jgi:hypothetical protein
MTWVPEVDGSSLAHEPMSTPKIYLFLIWLLQCVLVLSLAYLNPNHFTTVDSGYYLESATNILQGNGHRFTENGRLVWNSIFPMGYPASISLISFLTGLSVLWASKVVNLLASAVLLLLMNRWFKPNKALLLGCILLLGQFVKLWAHTWSEPLFLTILFAWTYCFFNLPKHYWTIFLLGTALILVRYAGVFIIPLSLVLGIYNLFKKHRTTAKIQILYAAGWITFFALYTGVNFLQSGELLGDTRFEGQKSLWHNCVSFTKGLLNEAFLFRDTDFHYFDLAFWVAIPLQAFTFILFFRLVRFQKSKLDQSVHYLLMTTITYLMFLFFARLLSPFDEPTYRLLSPFTFLFIGWFLLLIIPGIKNPKTFYRLGITTVLFSWLHLLPQMDISTKLQPLIRMLGF